MNVECAQAAKNVNTNSGTVFLELLSHPKLGKRTSQCYIQDTWWSMLPKNHSTSYKEVRCDEGHEWEHSNSGQVARLKKQPVPKRSAQMSS
jgi:hypothetical protein